MILKYFKHEVYSWSEIGNINEMQEMWAPLNKSRAKAK